MTAMRNAIAGTILCLLLPLGGQAQERFSSDSLSSAFQIRGSVGLIFFDPNQSFRREFRTVKPPFAVDVHVGLALQPRGKNWEIRLRRMLYVELIARLPGRTFLAIETETLLGFNQLRKLRPQHPSNKWPIRWGVDALLHRDPSISPRALTKWGVAPSIAIPVDWLEIELRAHWIVLPDLNILDANRYKLLLNYRF